MKWTHNPGSQAARNAGCICPVLDNNRGKYAPAPPSGWWITANCPVHTIPIAAPEKPASVERPVTGATPEDA
jgi:hypothetical protein